MTQEEKGILIIAQGKQRYINMAYTIAMSIKLSNPETSLALVTDSTDPELKKYYHHIIPIDPAFGTGFSQKIQMYTYSPFKKTMYIDVDCMVIQPIDFLWKLFDKHQVSVIGKKIFSGTFIGTTIEALKQHYSFDYLPTFNGGVYYFEKSDLASKVFKLAQEIFYQKYDTLNLWKFNGQPGDEPAMAIAMGVFQIQPVEDNRKGMYTPVGQTGIFKMDALSGYCEFYKHGEKVMPAIMHFGGGYPEAFHYQREQVKIKLVYNYKLPKKLVSAFINTCYNSVYALYVFGYRLVKSFFKKTKFKLTPVLPMFKFE
ncbi:MAG TPA: hypothetical protein VFF27_11230 [Bacteroidia bacterium]|jgi:hypothetical protein|nr:hypothetical protein [Bacteroidia bacterium]